MSKFLVSVREKQMVEGEVSFVRSSHVVEAQTVNEARTIFVSRKFPNEVIESVVLQEEVKKKKPVKH